MFKKNPGFTLIEVLMTLVVLSGALMIVSHIRDGNQKRLQKLSHYSKVTQLMESKISDLEFEWRKKAFASLPKSDKGDFKEEPHFSWSVVTQALSLLDPTVLMNVTGQSIEGIALEVAKVTSQFLSQAVLEVKLSIHYKKGDLKNAYSMTTYIVDHNKKIQMAGAP